MGEANESDASQVCRATAKPLTQSYNSSTGREKESIQSSSAISGEGPRSDRGARDERTDQARRSADELGVCLLQEVINQGHVD
jgi:hypothetical protein